MEIIISVLLVSAEDTTIRLVQDKKCILGRDPKLFSEFMFAVPSDVGAVLEVQVFDHRLIGFDTRLGGTTVPIESLPMAPDCRFHPLERGDVELFLSYTRCVVHPKAPLQDALPALRIVSERTNYFAGELVRGVVTYCVAGAPLDVYGVIVGASGRVHYHTTHKTHHRDSKGHTRTTTHHHHQYIDIFSHGAVVFGAEKAQKRPIKMAPGRYSWPVQLWIPPQAPPSAHRDTGLVGITVSYQLFAKVELVAKLKRDPRSALPVRVLNRYVAPVPYPVETLMKFAFQQSCPVSLLLASGDVPQN